MSSNKASKAAKAQAAAQAKQAEEAARLGRVQQEWYQREYEATKPQRDAEAARARQVADAQYASMLKANQRADELDARNKLVYQPLENSIISEAQNFDTEAKREELAGQAMAGTQQAFDNAQGQNMRSMLASGVNPNSGAALALREQGGLQKALGLAAAGNQARAQARQEGYARKMDATRFGQNVLGQQAGMLQLANGSGTSAVGSGLSSLRAIDSGVDLMGQGFGAAMQGMGMGNQSRQLAGQFQNTANYWQDQQGQAVGSALGSMADLFKNWGGAKGGGSTMAQGMAAQRPTIQTQGIGQSNFGLSGSDLTKLPGLGG